MNVSVSDINYHPKFKQNCSVYIHRPKTERSGIGPKVEHPRTNRVRIWDVHWNWESPGSNASWYNKGLFIKDVTQVGGVNTCDTCKKAKVKQAI